MVRVLALVPYPVGHVPGQRYRIEQWAPLMRPLGVEVVFSSFLPPSAMDRLYEPGAALPKAWHTIAGHARRALELRRLADYDVVYVYREAALFGPPWVEARAARRRPLVFDFDDAIWLPAGAAANAWTLRFKPRGKTAALCALARHVTVGNEVLAEFARAWAPSVTVIPSTIDTDLYTPRPRAPNAIPILGWTGSATTLPYLEALLPALLELRQRVPYRLRVVADREPRLPGVDVELVRWRAATEADDLRPLDVGLMPLADDAWSRGKGGMKALQYMALGIPAVVSPVGANAVIVEDGVSGLHARTHAEWVEGMRALLVDEARRRELGSRGRARVELEYSARVQAPRMAEVLRRAAA